jgi:regulator of protease activity HflC (stomatin/prohibitin superfamily)
MNTQASIVDVLIQNITTDQELLKDLEQKVQEAKEEKRAVTDRLKDYRKDIAVVLKYADESQRAKIEELGFEISDQDNGLNPVSATVMELLMKAKDNQMTNGELYESYVATFKNKEDAYSYTEFNIKCRQLFNTQRVLRKKSKDSSSSRDDVIAINGTTLPKQQPETKKKS